jgi:hypothetical protein
VATDIELNSNNKVSSNTTGNGNGYEHLGDDDISQLKKKAALQSTIAATTTTDITNPTPSIRSTEASRISEVSTCISLFVCVCRSVGRSHAIDHCDSLLLHVRY